MKIFQKLLLISIVFLYTNSYSQGIVNTGKLLQGGIDDGVVMVDAYLTPLNRMMMVGVNNSNFHSLYKDGGKRIEFGINSSFINIPTQDITYNVNNLQLKHIAAEVGHSQAQSVFGAESSITLYSRDSIPSTTLPGGGNNFPFKSVNLIDSTSIFSFNSAQGIDMSILVRPSFSFTYKFDFGNLSVDVLPYFSSESSVFIWGINWKQNLSMLIPALKDKKVKISSTVGYAHSYIKYALDVQPEGVSVPYSMNGEAIGPYDNQEIKLNYSGIYFDIHSEYTIKKFTLWAGIGYNIGFSNVQILGNYPIYGSDPTGSVSVTLTDIKDPMNLDGSYSRFKADLGARFNFGIFYTQLNYTIAYYGGFGLAIGVNF